FETKLTAQLRKLPDAAKAQAALAALPRVSPFSYPKPRGNGYKTFTEYYEAELQPEYLRIFPELKATEKSFLADIKKSKLIRDPDQLKTVEEHIATVKAGFSLNDSSLYLGDSAVSKSFMIRAYYDQIL